MVGRIGANEDSPFRVPLGRRPLDIMSPRLVPPQLCDLARARCALLMLDRDADGPDEAEQFSRHRRHHLLFVFASPEESTVAAV